MPFLLKSYAIEEFIFIKIRTNRHAGPREALRACMLSGSIETIHM